jgi:endonuclease YncB( thermonuclease family)
MVATIARRTRFFLLCVLIVGAAAAVSWYRERHATSINGRVRVIDGDSLAVAGVEVRLFGIDAPEYHQTCSRENGRWNCGIDAARALRGMIAGREVSCAPRDRDRYGRVVAVCRAGELDLGAAMIRGGFAVSYGAYEADEREARAARRGIWASRFDNPAVWRARHPRRER